MPLGPVEILCIKFPTTFIKDEITSALKALVESKTIRIIDILFIRKSESGEVTMNEMAELEDVDHSLLDPLVTDISGLISEEDVQMIGESLDNSSFAALMLFENIWATTFRDAILQADGQLLLSERIPNSAIEEALAQAAVSGAVGSVPPT